MSRLAPPAIRDVVLLRRGEDEGDDRIGVTMAKAVLGLQPLHHVHVLHYLLVPREFQPVLK